MNGQPDTEPIDCPHCQQVLEEGSVLLLSGMIVGKTYLCPPCKIIFLPDLKPLARLPEGVN